jgi:uncharacterized protein YjiK
MGIVDRPLSCSISAALLILTAAVPIVEAADSWPTDPGVEIGQVGTPGHLPAGYEPSGAVWHEGRSRLLIVDDGGLVSEMTADGDSVVSWYVGGDLEAITLSDPTGNLALIGREHPDAILEFELSAGLLTGASWDLTQWMTGSPNLGLEALTIVDGLAYAGLQETGEIFVFELLPGGTVVHVTTLPSPLGLNDISGLHYDQQTTTLFALYDTHNRLLEISGGDVYREYEVVGNDQEGFALIGGNAPGETTVFVAEDLGEVWRYTGYPIDWPAGIFSPELPRTAPRLRASPNPFHHLVTIQVDLDEASSVVLGVYDVLGRRIRTLTGGKRAAGSTQFTWDGRDEDGHVASASVHFLRLATRTATCRIKVAHID